MFEYEGRLYYCDCNGDNWYDVETDTKVTSQSVIKSLKTKLLKWEYPLISEGGMSFKAINAGSPGLGKRK